MTDAWNQLEQRLATAYTNQSRHYDGALRIFAERQQAGDGWVTELQAVLQQVAEIEAVIANDKQAWQQSGRHRSEPLRTILDGLATRIRALAELVDRCMTDLTAKRRQLMPELDGFIRQRRMLHAYDQFRLPIEN